MKPQFLNKDKNVSRIGVDIGGTFTDVTAVDEHGRLRIGKRLTTHGSEQEGVIQAITDTDIDLSSPNMILAHGTTLVINSLLERKGARIALVTTRGFADVLDIGRGNRGENLTLRFRRESPIVAREQSFEINERTYADGTISHVPSSEDLEKLIAQLREVDVEAVAIGFLNSYKNPENERRVAEYIRTSLPELPISISSDFSRQWREFERFTTSVANAYVAPVVSRYLEHITGSLSSEEFQGEFVVLDSSGGAMTVENAKIYPVRAVESGPVAGVIGARRLARSLGIDNLVSFDMGGTTAKSALIAGGEYATRDLYYIGGEAQGFPLQVGTVDIIEVGVGGGSIAWLDDTGRLRVGPTSAGSQPGPACYGLGGSEPTLTDANLYCGRIDAQQFSSSFHLDTDAAARSIEGLAQKAGMAPERLALGIIRLAILEASSTVRRQTLERGDDPRDFTLLASGGAGPMHACGIAREIGIKRVLVPRFPGHYSALGMLSANLRLERREVMFDKLSDLTASTLQSTLDGISKELANELRFSSSSGLGEVDFTYELSIRFKGQEHALFIPVPVSGSNVPEDVAVRLSKAFREEYIRRYGHADKNTEMQTVELLVVAERELPDVEIDYNQPDATASDTLLSLWDGFEGRIETPVLSRSSLSTGSTLQGPAVIYESGATTVVPPNAMVKVLEDGAMLIELEDVQ
ncbi:hydantoinase/oxoprolinase family protein [Peribacillus butanolivorans]|uniref:hydantoinase/oxoprolinase family protein n=1 Tax=Peribacillus butanolivorans TaxID=421767 RepID=UPI0036527698